jgi:hypothetical protein
VSGGYTWATISTHVESLFGVATTCGVTTTGVGYCWGTNAYGEVGDNTTTQRSTPTLVSGGYTWASITVGYEDVCGVTTTGVGYCWGLNSAGQGGNGTTAQKNVPTLISGGYTWASITVGWSFTCGVTTTNVGYCWGGNGHGVNGDGTVVPAYVPTLITGGYAWSQINAGANDTCGVTTTGVGYCWGYNWLGENGDGSSTEHHSPTLVSGGYTWAQISEGNSSTCGITTAGVAYCWGYNGAGEIGDGTTTSRATPTAVSGGLVFTAIVAGDQNSDDTTCGLTYSGILYCWGYNNESQIGDGTTTNRSTPTQASALYDAIRSTTVTVVIDPILTFTVANKSSACNGESNFVSGAGTSTAVALGHLAPSSNVSGGQTLTLTSNAAGGFVVYLRGTQASQNLRNASRNWTDVVGTYASPANLGANERFGYTYKDSTTSSSVTNPASAKFIALTSTDRAVMGSATSVSGSACVSFDAQTSATTAAGAYTATVIYTAIPTF